jgi:DUF438 domain-containing protein
MPRRIHRSAADRRSSSCHPRESDAKVEQLIDDIKAGVLDLRRLVNYRGRMLYEYILPIRGSHGEYLG